ncbi:MAG: hypothetical protein ABI772_09850 [Bacteroidota bacterium]
MNTNAELEFSEVGIPDCTVISKSFEYERGNTEFSQVVTTYCTINLNINEELEFSQVETPGYIVSLKYEFEITKSKIKKALF